MDVEADGFFPAGAVVGADGGLAGGASCAEAVVTRAKSPAAKATTILISEIPLSPWQDTDQLSVTNGNQGADFRWWEEREEK
jgi:hypothetical protein